jgi:hypothetical protein
MTEQEIDIAIAEACGWKWKDNKSIISPKGSKWARYSSLAGVDQLPFVLPDYCHDLNAMADAEETLSREQRLQFAQNISEMFHGPEWRFAEIHATARQRAEAFLRVKGLWVEDGAVRKA